jgi:hypothetical protein
MGKRIGVATTLVGATLATIAAVAMATSGIKPVVVRDGNLVVTLGGGVIPNRLPVNELKPITVTANGKVATADGTHPPAIDEVILDAGGTAVIKANDFPACRQGEIEATTTKQAEAKCKDAIVGRGKAAVEVQFAESSPFTAKGPLVIFNGGERNGKALMLVHAYVSVPAPTALITSIITTKEHKGSYLLRTVAKLPPIAGGAGSVKNFSLAIDRKGYLLADCSHGNFSVLATVKFRDRSPLSGRVVQPCIPTK